MEAAELEENTSRPHAIAPDAARVRAIEARVRDIRRSIDELGEALQHHADQLRSHSTRILTEIADQVTSSKAQEAVVLGSEITPRIHRAVSSEVERIVGLAQELARDITRRTSAIGHEFGRSDSPEQSGITSLIRDVPQFEMTPQVATVPVGNWKMPDGRLFRSRVRRALMEQFREPLQESLEDYSPTLQQWARSLASALHESVTSYVDAFSRLP